MSTRAHVAFGFTKNFDEREAMVYVHNDGHPKYMGNEFLRFFDAIQATCEDTRFDDPEYLAAKYVVWRMEGRVENIGVSISREPHYSAAFLYLVVCNTNGETPEVYISNANDRNFITLARKLEQI